MASLWKIKNWKKKKRRKKKVTKDWLGKWLYINRADIAHGKIILFKQDWNLRERESSLMVRARELILVF